MAELRGQSRISTVSGSGPVRERLTVEHPPTRNQNASMQREYVRVFS